MQPTGLRTVAPSLPLLSLFPPHPHSFPLQLDSSRARSDRLLNPRITLKPSVGLSTQTTSTALPLLHALDVSLESNCLPTIVDVRFDLKRYATGRVKPDQRHRLLGTISKHHGDLSDGMKPHRLPLHIRVARRTPIISMYGVTIMMSAPGM